MEEQPLVNRVAQSGLITLNLENYFPSDPIVSFDLKDYLFKEFILKEKDFRIALKEINWEQYQDKIVTVYCSNDAIIPVWAYMLVTSYATPFAKTIFQGTQEAYLKHHFELVLKSLDLADYEGKKMVVKGCSDLPVPASAYVTITRLFQPIVSSIMYGEPCSTVPIYKQRPIRKNTSPKSDSGS